MNDILYYPYINLPRTDWTLRSLLYYDTVGSIVPREYINNPENQFDPFMLELVQAGLVNPIDPMISLKNPFEFSANFRNYVLKHEKRLKKRSQSARVNQAMLNNQKFSGINIHGEKFESEIFYSLQQLGLAEHQYGNWFKVEKTVANLLMKSLAGQLSADLEMLPTTDQIGITAYLTQRTESINKRNTILKELIPFPENIDLNRLRRFKDKHGDLLNAFKNRIEIITLDKNVKQDSAQFGEILNELNIRKEELTAKMNESQFGNILFGTVCGLLSGAIGFTASENTLVGVASALPSLANATHSALKIERAENIFDQSGMKYLALIDKRLRR
ncbi:kinase [Flavobacterium sp. W1B]|uniref:kinase n=1 Tax=Flavobacterium sp. W1B TaxID=3394146 RepID=UPI0039BC642A